MNKRIGSPENQQPVRVSLIVPVYNVAPYLRDCLDSLVGQTLKEIEILCFDDCSTDESGSILDQYAQADTRVQVVHYDENKTAAQARKDGTLLAKGQYIIYVDGDDSLTLDACERLVAKMDEANVDMIQFNTEVIADEVIPQARMDALIKLLFPYEGKLTGNLLKECFEEGKFHFQIWNKIFKAELCKQAMTHFPDGRFSKGQDLFAFYLIAFFAKSYLGIPEEKYYRYGFGRGVTGHTRISCSTMKRYAEQAFVVRGIEQFLRKMKAEDDCEGSLKKVTARLFNDSFSQMKYHVTKEDVPYAFDVLCECWGVDTILGELVTKEVYQSKQWADRLLASPSFRIPPRKVKRIATFYHSIANGGAQRVVVNLINIWVSLGYEVVLYTDEEPSTDDYPLAKGVERIVLPAFALNDAASRAERMKVFHRSLKKKQIDMLVYHAWVAPSVLWDMLCAKLAGTFFYVHCHSVFSMPLLSTNITNRFFELQSIYQLADGVMTLSETDSCYWRNFNSRVMTVVNPMTENLKEAALSSLGGKTLLWVGRISTEKNPVQIIEIFSRVHSVHSDSKLKIVGKGTEALENRMLQRAKELEIENYVEMCGFHQDVMPFYLQSDVMLMTSQYEGFPLTLQEAQSHGLPCVLYDLPHLTLLEDGKGVYPVPMGDKDAAADAIIRLFNDRELLHKVGAEARENVISKCQIDFGDLWTHIIHTTELPYEPLENSFERRMMVTLSEHIRINVEVAKRRLAAVQKSNPSSVSVPSIQQSMPEVDMLEEANQTNSQPITIWGRCLHKLRTLLWLLETGGFASVKRVLKEKKEAKALSR